jgi:hypothetical protein
VFSNVIQDFFVPLYFNFLCLYTVKIFISLCLCTTAYATIAFYQWRIQGGALGASAHPSNNSSTNINIRFSRLVNVTIWLLIEWFRSVMKVKENTNEFLCIELIFKEVPYFTDYRSNCCFSANFLGNTKIGRGCRWQLG